MEVYQDGVRVNVLPDCAVCKADERKRNPMDIDVCPCGYEICTDCCHYDEIVDTNNMDLQDMAARCYKNAIEIVEKGGIE